MKFSFSMACAAALVAALPLTALAASPAKPTAKAAATAKVGATVVGLFEGMDSGDIEVKVIPKDSTEGLVTIKNKTGKPLAIKIPDALAGVPALAQFGGGGFGGEGVDAGGAGGGGGGGSQGFSGGGMMGAGMGGMGGQAGGFFNVGPEKIGKLKLVTVCMDHGKKDPNPRVPYKLIPIESYAKNAHVTEVVKMMVKGEIDQHSAQAAVWHLQNGLTWEELAAKIGAKHLDGTVDLYFNPLHLEQAIAAVKIGGERAAKATKEQPRSIGDELASQR